MTGCQHCGAPIALSQTAVVTCRFCDRPNNPLPKEIEVPVPVQVVHNVVNVQRAADAPVEELRCPHCKKRMVQVRVVEVELWGCGGCGGIWIENASARNVLANPEAIFAELAERAGHNARNRGSRDQRPSCAGCPAVLDRIRMHGIDLDVCADHGTWFDAFELKTLVEKLTGKAPASFHPGDTRRIRCASCQVELGADRANISDNGLVCEICWRKRESELVAEGDAQAQARGSVAVAGVLLGVAAVMLGGMASSNRS
jgi:Zn-finger nucleic acid-binding protein